MIVLNTDRTTLKKTLYKKGMSQSQLSKITGIAYAQLNGYCNGLVKPRKRTQKVIAKALGVSVEDIFTEQDKAEN